MPGKRMLRGLGLIGFIIITVACGLVSNAPTLQPAEPSATVPLPVFTETSAATPTAVPTATVADTAAAPAEVLATPTSEPQAGLIPTATSGMQVLAYLLVDENLWIYQDGGEPRPMTSSGDVRTISAAHDGAWVAFVRSADQLHYSLWAVRADGSGERELVSAAEFDAIPRPPEAIALSVGEMQWVPGAQMLAFSTRPFFEGPGPASSEDLWLVNVETGERRQLLAPGEGGSFTFSPDGQQIALARADAISLINRDGSNRRERVLTYPPVQTYSEWIYYPDVRWAADSSALRVVIPPEAALERPEEPATIWSIPVDGSAPRQLSSVVARPLTYPQLSPDGTQVAYLRAAGGQAETNRNELHIASADGDQDVLYLTNDLLMFEGWAPDSQQFVFSVPVDPVRIYLGRVGETPQALNDTPNMLNVQWLDEDRFLFVTRTMESVELRQGSAGTSSQLIYRAAEPTEMLNFSIPE